MRVSKAVPSKRRSYRQRRQSRGRGRGRRPTNHTHSTTQPWAIPHGLETPCYLPAERSADGSNDSGRMATHFDAFHRIPSTQWTTMAAPPRGFSRGHLQQTTTGGDASVSARAGRTPRPRCDSLTRSGPVLVAQIVRHRQAVLAVVHRVSVLPSTTGGGATSANRHLAPLPKGCSRHRTHRRRERNVQVSCHCLGQFVRLGRSKGVEEEDRRRIRSVSVVGRC